MHEHMTTAHFYFFLSGVSLGAFLVEIIHHLGVMG